MASLYLRIIIKCLGEKIDLVLNKQEFFQKIRVKLNDCFNHVYIYVQDVFILFY